ncbi:MAG: RnfABCDGE type electron transport complex subunit D [Clostridia bacterium]|nr:RnfABCDGE type electron transport complex subunit D [Clostridia bacterium]
MPSKKKQRIRRGAGGVFHFDALLMLLPLGVMAVYYHGVGALMRILACMAAGVLAEAVGARLMRCPRDISDCSALFIGAATALMLPADIPYYVPLCGVAFAIAVVKLPLGGTDSVPFVPTAAGFAFMTLCWPDLVFRYPAIGTGSEYVQGASLAGMLHRGISIRPNTVNIFDILIGNFPGPMGASCVLVLAAGMIYLAVRYRRAIVNTLAFLLAASIMALAFPRVHAGNAQLTSLLMELCSGLLIFAAVFFVTDPAISPQKVGHRFLYGFFSGVVCMLLRYFSHFEDSVCFGILIADAVWPAVEVRLKRAEKKRKKARKAKALAKEGASDA